MSSSIISEIEWISFFKEIGFDESESNAFAAKFFAAKIRQEVMKFLNDDDLVKIGIEALGDRKLILLSIKKKDDVMGETPGSLEDNDDPQIVEGLRKTVENLFQSVQILTKELKSHKTVSSYIYIGEAAAIVRDYITTLEADPNKIEDFKNYCSLND